MSRLDSFSREELEQMVQECTSMRELLLRCGYVTFSQNDRTVRRRLEAWDISTAHFTGMSRTKTKRSPANVFIKGSTASQDVVRAYYKKGAYTPYRCAVCGLDAQWQGKPLSLTLDHINGDNRDHRLQNLRWVCPNCDRQLDTFGSRNYARRKLDRVKAGAPSGAKRSQPLQQLDVVTEKVIAEYPSVYAAERALHVYGLRAHLKKATGDFIYGGFLWHPIQLSRSSNG